MCRSLIIIAASCLLTWPATAGEPDLTKRVSCVLVRYYVAKYSAPAAEAYARGKGASDAQIEAARRCLSQTILAQGK
jgi:hypothetical protein